MDTPWTRSTKTSGSRCVCELCDLHLICIYCLIHDALLSVSCLICDALTPSLSRSWKRCNPRACTKPITRGRY